MIQLTILRVGVAEGRQVQAGAGQEALQEGGPVLHPPQPALAAMCGQGGTYFEAMNR